MGQAQINARTRACSRTSIARTKQAALTHSVRGKRLNSREKTGLVCYYSVIMMSPLSEVLNASSVWLETTT